MATTPRRILVAVPPEGDGHAVVDYAAELTRSLGAELVLVAIAPMVPPLMTGDYPSDPFYLEAERQRQEIANRLAREKLDELVSTLAPAPPLESALTWGPVGLATVEAAREHHADLVVVPMRARDHELGHVLHDHADRYVLHHCDVPVLVVPTTV